MKFKTRSIVFNYVKFRESSIIARVYTEEYGLKNYIVNNVRSAKPRHPVSLFQPLTQLEMIVYNKPQAEINRIAEIKCAYPYHTIPFDVIKSTVCLFLTEILFKILREEEANKELFGFLTESFIYFDAELNHFTNFHLQFLIRLTGFLGISPVNVDEMIDEAQSPGFVPESEKILFDKLIRQTYSEPVDLDNRERRKFLALILQFYQHHFDHLSEIKSFRILKEVFD
ncbi:MAG: recombination protein O N-terminal domain-containing protein [Cyclobacteriaceae bacterium]|nr:recombination protein O N-terminal domain-containing protein [Cyclobacteriaceae bacterium]